MLERPTRIRDRLLLHEYVPIAIYLGLAGWSGIATRGWISPTSLELLPDWLVVMWTVAIALGGIAAPLGALLDATRLESAGLAMLAYGAGLYGAVGAVALWPGSVMVVALSAAVVSMSLIRMRKLSLARRAQDLATAIRRDRDGE